MGSSYRREHADGRRWRDLASPPREGAHLLKPLRQIIESINGAFTGRPGRPGPGRPGGVMVRVLRRILALTAAIWPDATTGQQVPRLLAAGDH